MSSKLELDKQPNGRTGSLPDGYALVGWGFLAVLALIFAFASWHYDGINRASRVPTFAQLPPAGPVNTTASIGREAVIAAEEPTDLDVFSTPSVRSTEELDRRVSAELATLRREVVQLRRSVSALRELNTNLFARIDELEKSGPLVTGGIETTEPAFTDRQVHISPPPRILAYPPSSTDMVSPLPEGAEVIGKGAGPKDQNVSKPEPEQVLIPAETEVTAAEEPQSDTALPTNEEKPGQKDSPTADETAVAPVANTGADALETGETGPSSDEPDRSEKQTRPVRVIALSEPPSLVPEEPEAATDQIAALTPVDREPVPEAAGPRPIVTPSSKPGNAVTAPTGAVPVNARSVEDPASISATRTSFAADLGVFSTREEMVQAWVQLKEDSPDLLQPLTAVFHVQDNGQADPYRLLAGPFVNAADAATLCVRLAAKKIECQPSLYLGETLSLQ